VGEVLSAYKILARKLKEKECWYLGDITVHAVCSIKMNLKEGGCSGMEWINLAEVRW
jgi:hypothetical protein